MTPTPTDREALAKIKQVRAPASGDGIFLAHKDLPEELRKYLFAVEMFVADVCGKDICTWVDDDTCHDEGTIDAGDAVNALNALIAGLLLPQAAREQALEEAAKEARRVGLEYVALLGGDSNSGAGASNATYRIEEAILALKSTPSPVERQEDVEREATPEEAAYIDRMWAGLEGEADKWAEEVDLTAWIKNIVQTGRLNRSVPDEVREKFIHRQETLIDAFVRQVFAEGFYRGGESRKEYDASLLRTPQAETQGGDAPVSYQKAKAEIEEGWPEYSPVSERERVLEQALAPFAFLTEVYRGLPDSHQAMVYVGDLRQAQEAYQSPATSPALDGWKPIERENKNE